MRWDDVVASVPASHADAEVEIDLEEGPMPSGEEGAEDWITSCTLKGVEFGFRSYDNQKYVSLKVWHG